MTLTMHSTLTVVSILVFNDDEVMMDPLAVVPLSSICANSS